MIKVSVIIPVYNVEQYLEECLNSIINQTLKEIEIICVDDCSKDNSYLILDKYKDIDSRIILIKHNINRGLGPARNTGLSRANGEYIFYMDSDDYISNDYIQTLYVTAKKYNSDIVSNLNINADYDGKIIPYKPETFNNLINWKKQYPKNYLEGESFIEITENYEGKKEFLSPMSWNKLFKREFLISNELYFMDIALGAEDVDLYYRVIANKPKTSYNHKGYYFYRQRNSSLMKEAEVNINSIIATISHMNNCIEYCKIKCDENFMKYLMPKICDLIFYRYSIFLNKEEAFIHIHNFYNKVQINKDFTNDYLYYNYMLIKISSNYDNYLFFMNFYEDITKRIENVKNDNEKWFRLFGICKSKRYIKIVVFGITFTVKFKINCKE